MEGVFAFQRTGVSVTIVTTTSAGTTTALVVANGGVVEIANLHATGSARFLVTDAGASAGSAAVSTSRAIPPMTVLHERLPQGASYVSAIGVATADVSISFTPGVSNG